MIPLLLINNTLLLSHTPSPTLFLCSVDLGHLRTVKMDKHMRFADEHNMYSYLVSAKTGDNVSSAFYRIAADLAGCALSKNELEGAAVSQWHMGMVMRAVWGHVIHYDALYIWRLVLAFGVWFSALHWVSFTVQNTLLFILSSFAESRAIRVLSLAQSRTLLSSFMNGRVPVFIHILVLLRVFRDHTMVLNRSLHHLTLFSTPHTLTHSFLFVLAPYPSLAPITLLSLPLFHFVSPSLTVARPAFTLSEGGHRRDCQPPSARPRAGTAQPRQEEEEGRRMQHTIDNNTL